MTIRRLGIGLNADGKTCFLFDGWTGRAMGVNATTPKKSSSGETRLAAATHADSTDAVEGRLWSLEAPTGNEGTSFQSTEIPPGQKVEQSRDESANVYKDFLGNDGHVACDISMHMHCTSTVDYS
jgi:hypothetical protein